MVVQLIWSDKRSRRGVRLSHKHQYESMRSFEHVIGMPCRLSADSRIMKTGMCKVLSCGVVQSEQTFYQFTSATRRALESHKGNFTLDTDGPGLHRSRFTGPTNLSTCKYDGKYPAQQRQWRRIAGDAILREAEARLAGNPCEEKKGGQRYGRGLSHMPTQ
jgi:hypothetical protein